MLSKKWLSIFVSGKHFYSLWKALMLQLENWSFHQFYRRNSYPDLFELVPGQYFPVNFQFLQPLPHILWIFLWFQPEVVLFHKNHQLFFLSHLTINRQNSDISEMKKKQNSIIIHTAANNLHSRRLRRLASQGT